MVCQSCILLVYYILQTCDARKLKYEIVSKITRCQIAEVAVTYFENHGNMPTVIRCPFRLKGKGKVVPVRAIKACRGNRCAAPLINVGAKWRCVINFTPRPIYPQVRPSLSIASKAAWAPQPIRTF